MTTLLPIALRERLSESLRGWVGRDVQVVGFNPSSGGCINNGGKMDTTAGAFFIKWNDAGKFPRMFEAEAKGLNLLRESGTVNVPTVVGTGVIGSYQFLVLEHIERAPTSSTYWRRLGQDLGSLHQISAKFFGLDHDNYIGSLTQNNKQEKGWIEFFIRQRLEKQLLLAKTQGEVDDITMKKFQKLYEKLPSLLPEEDPSLLHGDLWSGNIMVNSKGEPSLIDPAVYFGNREVDLAMTQLFGGFNLSFIESYNACFPLVPGFQERVDIYNLYPLLVHVNLFGGGYLSQVKNVLNRYC
jgi:protein-ribulosamine 3-kinase